jgi:hypothetical protein
MVTRLISLGLALATTGCADPLHSSDAADAGSAPSVAPSEPAITATDNPDGTATVVVDATGERQWIYLNLQTKQQTTPIGPETAADWDLGFQRFKIKLNGGVSGSGGVEVAAVAGADFDAVTEAPTGPYRTDAADSADDDDEEPELALVSRDMGWFDYDPRAHVLSPKDVVYVVRSVNNGYFKLRLLGYYDDAGTSGYLTLQVAPIAAPAAAHRARAHCTDPAALVPFILAGLSGTEMI